MAFYWPNAMSFPAVAVVVSIICDALNCHLGLL